MCILPALLHKATIHKSVIFVEYIGSTAHGSRGTEVLTVTVLLLLCLLHIPLLSTFNPTPLSCCSCFCFCLYAMVPIVNYGAPMYLHYFHTVCTRHLHASIIYLSISPCAGTWPSANLPSHPFIKYCSSLSSPHSPCIFRHLIIIFTIITFLIVLTSHAPQSRSSQCSSGRAGLPRSGY